ncbi:MAG: DNA-binding transcriptional regulator [Sedimentisphaerales bacterium]|nr:DNA-binding transcriptional regulator [Sedimentisphaerales bacterium]
MAIDRIPRIILLVETSHEFGRELLRGIARYSRLHGPWTFYREPSGLSGKFPKLLNNDADGIIVRGDAINPEEIRSLGLPAVLLPRTGDHVPGFCCVKVDSLSVGIMGAIHLLERGFQHFAFCGFSDMPWSQKRRDGFRQKLNEHGITPNVYEQQESVSVHSWSREQKDIAEWLNSLPKPVGIMACTDYRGQHVLEGCKVAGLHVPEDVAVVGVLNDDIICDLCDPPLSSIALNIEKSGYEAAALLDQLMTGQVVHEQDIIIQPVYVVVRRSTDIFAIEDSIVSKALHYMRQHVRQPIQVSDVVSAVGLSRRALEQRFQRAIGRSVLSEIRRLRVELIAQLLVETNSTVTQIAQSLNFTSEKHIARAFRQEKGISPLMYRKKYGR